MWTISKVGFKWALIYTCSIFTHTEYFDSKFHAELALLALNQSHAFHSTLVTKKEE